MEALPPWAVCAKTSGAIFAAIPVSFGPAADDHAIIASNAPAKNKAKLAATFT